MNEVEKVKKDKEIEDIISERNEIQRLLNESNWGELQTHLQNLNAKYCTEVFVYNVAHPNPPKDVKENAENCISFLHTLLEAKTVDAVKNDK